MTSKTNRPASEVYEVVTRETAGPKSWLRSAVVLVGNLINGVTGGGDAPVNPGGRIITVVERSTGDEKFRHIEDMGDDDGHLLHGIETDLTTMSAAEFKVRWVD